MDELFSTVEACGTTCLLRTCVGREPPQDSTASSVMKNPRT